MNVTVLITCWNGRTLLEKNLPRVIKASKNPKNKIKEIIVVDDGSTDDSVSFLEKNFPEVKVIIHGKNKGYSAVCNTGVKQATGDLVVILNLDVIPQENFLEDIFPLFENNNVFAVSFNEGKFGPGKLGWKNGFLEIVPTGVSLKTSESDWANGGSSVFRKKTWQDLGGMDEIFLPFYFEDIDLGIRARNKGYQCLWEPKAKVTHEHEATINSTNFRRKYIDSIKERNQLLLIWKNIDTPKLLINHFQNLLKRLLSAPGYLKIIILALVRKIFYRVGGG